MKSALIASVLLLFTCQLCLAQSTNQGAVVGTVTDESNSLVPGVTVTITETKTGASRTATSNQQGDYTLDYLTPGTYRVSGERQGFKRSTVPEVKVQVSTVTRVDLKMSIGEVAEEVTIASEETGVNTQNAVIGEVIDNRKIQNLPLNGREFMQLAGLVPGANTNNVKRGTTLPGSPQENLVVGFNGARAGQNAFFVDGADARDPSYGMLEASPALDAIKEFRIETNMYSAQYGRAGGGVINIVTNSGTNSFHGTMYEYHRDKRLDAAPFFDHRTYDNRSPYLFNQFGASVGGPVYLPKFGEGGPGAWVGKNKTFFFFSIEKFRQKKPGQLISSMGPTTRERNYDFSQSINPWTNQPVVLRNPYTFQPIPGNVLPASLILPVGQTLFNLFPDANYFGDPFLNFRTYRSGKNNQDKYLLHMDHHFNSRNTLGATWNYSNYAYTSVAMTEYGDKNSISKDKTLVLTYTSVLTNNLVNEFTFNINRYNSGDDFVKNDKNYGKEWGVVNNLSPGSPRILLYTAGYNYAVLGNDGSNLADNHHEFYKDNVAWTRGNHSLKFGGEFKDQRYLWVYDSGLAAHLMALLDGDPIYDIYYGATGYHWSTLLTGLATYSYIGLGTGRKSPMSRKTFGFYGQDDWKFSPRLTLNFGLRWDYDPPFSSDDHKFMTLDFATGKPLYAAGAPPDELKLVSFPFETGGPNRPFDPKKTDFAPKFGFAYRLFNDDSTVLRGGYGIYYTTENAWSTVYGTWSVPYGGLAYYYSRGWAWPDGKDRFFRIDQAPPDFAYAFGKNPGFSWLQNPYFPSSYMQQWNLTLSRDLGHRFVGEVAYIGSKGTNLSGGGGLYDYSQALNDQVLATVPGWSISLTQKGYNSSYNALQAKLRKDLSAGLSFLASYTWGHALAEASNDSYNENSIRDQTLAGSLTVRHNSNADFDVRHRFTVAGNYELPIGRGRKWGNGFNTVANAIVGGWDLNYIYAFQSGFPYNVLLPDYSRPDRICDGNLPKSQRDPEHWFDTSCFVAHPPKDVILPNGTPWQVNVVGNSGNNIIQGPSLNNIDLGVHKNFHFDEQRRLEFRFETFNTLNHPQFIGPGGYSSILFTSSSGNKMTAARDPRSIQLALKFIF